MPRYSFMWYEENTVHVSFEAANISSATEYFEDLQNGKFEIDDLPKIKGQWKNGQTEYLDLEEMPIEDDLDIYTIKEKIEVEYDPDPDKVYKEGLENG
jgi:hypothetical protein